jgi:hypothetical protein
MSERRRHAWDDPFIRWTVIVVWLLAVAASVATWIWGK